MIICWIGPISSTNPGKWREVSPYTLKFYKQHLMRFVKYCDAQVLGHFEDITPNVVRWYLVWHEETGHNPDGLHAAFRVLRTFLLWYESEAEPDSWTNPIHKVKAPKLAVQLLVPVCQRQLDLPMATIRNAHGGCEFACFRRSRPAAQKGLRRRAPSRGAVWGFPLDGAQSKQQTAQSGAVEARSRQPASAGGSCSSDTRNISWSF